MLSAIWEAFKAYLRGKIISYTAYENKLSRGRLSELSCCIAQLDEVYATSPSPDIYKDHITLQTERDTSFKNPETNMNRVTKPAGYGLTSYIRYHHHIKFQEFIPHQECQLTPNLLMTSSRGSINHCTHRKTMFQILITTTFFIPSINHLYHWI